MFIRIAGLLLLAITLSGCPKECNFSFPEHAYCDALLPYADGQIRQYQQSGQQDADRIMYGIEQRMKRAGY